MLRYSDIPLSEFLAQTLGGTLLDDDMSSINHIFEEKVLLQLSDYPSSKLVGELIEDYFNQSCYGILKDPVVRKDENFGFSAEVVFQGIEEEFCLELTPTTEKGQCRVEIYTTFEIHKVTWLGME